MGGMEQAWKGWFVMSTTAKWIIGLIVAVIAYFLIVNASLVWRVKLTDALLFVAGASCIGYLVFRSPR